MELKRKSLLKKHKVVVTRIKDILDKGFYLAGGTAVYYYLNHRHSIGLDFFINEKIDFRELYPFFQPEEIKFLSKDTIHAEIENVNVSFFQYLYPLLNPLRSLDLIKIASLEDILCMKINAIISRGSRKDFVDVYFIMNFLEIDSEKAIELFRKKFGNYDELVIKKAVTYFEDTEKEPEFPMIKKIEWGEIKKFFIREFAKI
ncbi:MAG: nucleotidyl transferase AbiEii/AbiGii toxin family protein [Candidatus Hydrothermales bacterium]